MPGIGAVVGRRVRHEEHAYGRGVRGLHQLAADAQRVIVQVEVHGIGGGRVHDGAEHDPRLLGLVVHRHRHVPVQLTGPDAVLALDDDFVAGAQAVQLLRRDDLRQDDEAVVEQLLRIYLHWPIPLPVPRLRHSRVRVNPCPPVATRGP